MPAHILVCLITNESMGGEPALLGAPSIQSSFEGKGSLWQGCKSAIVFAYIDSHPRFTNAL